MKKATLAVAMGAALLCAAAVRATPTPQEQCDYARVTAWKVYRSCIEGILAKDFRGIYDAKKSFFDARAAFARCRHVFFKKWTRFQDPDRAPSLVGTTCDQTAPTIGGRFTDNGNQTVTDNLSNLVWEKKDSLDGSPNLANPHDADNGYSWSATGSAADGNAFTSFLAGLNGPCFAGQCDWRLPTIAELQTVLLDFNCTTRNGCTCLTSPCIESALGPTHVAHAGFDFVTDCYSATTAHYSTGAVYHVNFDNGSIWVAVKRFNGCPGCSAGFSVRAVRGGLN